MRSSRYGMPNRPNRGQQQRRAFARMVALACGVLGCLAVAAWILQSVVAALASNPSTATQPIAARSTAVPPTAPVGLAPTLPKTNSAAANGAPTPDTFGMPPIVLGTRTTVEHFIVSRPVTTNVTMPYPDPVYLYGTTEKGQFEVHHGEDFENPIGTPLYAAADGVVVTAGSDAQPICGGYGNMACGPSLESGGYYGEVVVLQLKQTYKGQPVYALYGHMNRIAVSNGDPVKQGAIIGEVGMTGVAIGPHIHFEIRLGVNDYAHTRNPVLWMTPLAGFGSLAGRYIDAQGKPVADALVDIYRPDYTLVRETQTYSRDRWPAVNPDDELGENFSMGDLPDGDYIVRIYGQSFEQHVTIQDGKLSFVEIGGL